jgi:ATP-dependent DNA helicase RecG
VVNTATLLFAKQVSRFSLQAKLVCAVFQGTSKSKILDKQTFQDGVLQDYQAAMSYLSSRLNTEYIIQSGPRQEVLELPEEALREAVLNAIAHRDYRSTSCVQIHIFKDRVEISNPGGLVPGLKVEDLGKVSRPRNILLFSMMERMDLVETVGSGIKRIRDAMKDYGLDLPRIESGDDWFSVTFTRKPQQVSVEDTTQKTTQKRTTQKQKLTTQKTRAEILALTRRDPTVTTEQLAEHIGITRHGIRYHLNKLEQEGVIYRADSGQSKAKTVRKLHRKTTQKY